MGSSWRKFIVVISDFPINFASHSILASLFSSQGPGRAGAPRCRALVCACRTPYSRFRLLRRFGCLYTIQVLACFRSPLVGSNGLEPSTSRLSGVRSNHLSYEPISVAGSFPIGQTCRLRFAFASVRDCRLPFRSDRNATWLGASPWWRRTESNCRPPACKAGALPAELRPHIRFVPSGESTLFEGSSFRRALKIKQCNTYLITPTILAPFDLDV